MNFSNRSTIAGGGGFVVAVLVLSLVAVPPAQAEHSDDPDEDARYWMECEFERHDGQPSRQEPSGSKESFGDIYVDIVSDYPRSEYHTSGGRRTIAADTFRLSLTHDTTDSSDVSLKTRSIGVSRRQGEGLRTRSTGALSVKADSRREHDETFSLSFTIDGVSDSDQAGYVKDMDDPRYDNKCEFTIIDHRDDALDVSQVFHFIGEFPHDRTITGPVGNYFTDGCASASKFYADWIPYYESGGSWHHIDATEWEHDILWASGGLADADFAISHGSYTYTVSESQPSVAYGQPVGTEITVPTIDGTITRGEDDHGSFHLRVRAKVDGEWQPYLIPMYFGCAGGV